MDFRLRVTGDWNDTFRFLERCQSLETNKILNDVGRRGVEALKANTPLDTGLASSSWGYVITSSESGLTIEWHNYDIEGGYNVAILVEYGHGLHQGGYVRGRDFINPAMQPVFDYMAEEVWKEVNKA